MRLTARSLVDLCAGRIGCAIKSLQLTPLVAFGLAKGRSVDDSAAQLNELYVTRAQEQLGTQKCHSTTRRATYELMKLHQTNKCRLCNRTRVLANSHIVPEWAYLVLYNHQHKFLPIRFRTARADRAEQKGFRQKLLCADCESRFSKYEGYAKQFFLSLCHENHGELRLEKLTGAVSRISNFDYFKLRYFLLSMLWRMSVCTREQFAGYKIPDEEAARELLLSEGNIPEQFYPVVISRTTVRGKYLDSLLLTYKEHIRVEGIDRFRIVIMGICLDYFIGPSVTSQLLRFQCLKEDGSFLLSDAEVGDLLDDKGFPRLLRSQRLKDHYRGLP